MKPSKLEEALEEMREIVRRNQEEIAKCPLIDQSTWRRASLEERIELIREYLVRRDYTDKLDTLAIKAEAQRNNLSEEEAIKLVDEVRDKLPMNNLAQKREEER